MKSSFAGRRALVTGASAGLGAEFARQLVELGVTRLALGARRGDRLAELKAQLEKSGTVRVDLYPIDLGNDDAVTQFMADLAAADFWPEVLINNAGLGDLGTFETSEPAKIEAMLAVNVVALTRLTRWAVPNMLERKSGWICNVGSTAGMIPLPTFAAYAATKAYVNSFSEALRVELHGSGVRVLALCPGPVETEFGQVASRPSSQRRFAAPAFLAVTKEEVVRQTLAALERGQGRLIPGLSVRFSMLLAESTPRWLLRFFFSAASGQFRRERAERGS